MGKTTPHADGAPDPLRAYRDKRSADRTSEPFGGETAPPGAPAPDRPRVFVVQKHAARRLHWDLRLEVDGVLRSWALPQGPSLDPKVKRLAVLTEDHPLEYRDFEGVIPEGNYGAGAMIVWDRGVYLAREKEGEGFEAGKLLFELRGHKLRGLWTLVRTKRGKGNEWLLIKKQDDAAVAGESSFDERSIVSGATVEELAAGIDRAGELARALAAEGAPPRAADATFEPMLCETAQAAFDDDAWLFELKYDGYRMLAHKRGGRTELRYRSGRVASTAFPELVAALDAVPAADFVLDGEVVVLEDDGRPSFSRLARRAALADPHELRRAALADPVTFYAFDLLGVGELDLRGLPLRRRKHALTQLLPGSGTIRRADDVRGRGRALLEQVRRVGVEGIVAKRIDSPYAAGRSEHWLKIRLDHADDFVVVGYRRPQGSRIGVGSLHLASHRHERLVWVGRVGSGMSDEWLAGLRELLDAIRRPDPPCDEVSSATDEDVWCEPRLVCEVRFREITDSGHLRFPVFLRMRTDKAPRECALRDEPGPVAEPSEAPPPAPAAPARDVVVVNATKVFWPASGHTKGDLVAYYRAIAPWLLVWLRDRPLVLTRHPDGIEGKSFFQKNPPPYVPDWLTTRLVWSDQDEREVSCFVCDDVEALTWVVNLGAIALHVWSSRLAALGRPDWCVLDLDPKGAPFTHVVRLALAARALCEEIGLPSFVKTSGSTGLHVLVPLAGGCTHEQARSLGQVLSRVLVDRHPDIATVARALERREGKVYLDWVQNGHGRLIVAPFSARPLPGAPVSTPLTWDEVHEGLAPSRFDIDAVPRRMAARGTDPLAELFSAAIDLPAALARLADRLPG